MNRPLGGSRCSTWRKTYSRRPTQGGRLELMLRQNSDWVPDRARGRPVRRGAAVAAPLHAGPLGRLRSRRPPSSADTRPLGSASRRGRHGGRVLSCELATLLRVVEVRPGGAAAHWAAGTRLGIVAGAVPARQGSRCLQLPAGGLPCVRGWDGLHLSTRRPRATQ